METRLTETRKHKSCDRLPQEKFQQEEYWSVKFINYLSYLETEKSSEEVKLYYQLLIPLLFRVKNCCIHF